jgi:hypothetical protein
MTLSAGSRIGPYQVSPTAFSGDVERLRRFPQEARAAAALNHPNILAARLIHAHVRS